MIKLIDILLEEYPKGQYIPLGDEEKQQAQQDLFDLISMGTMLSTFMILAGVIIFLKKDDIK